MLDTIIKICYTIGVLRIRQKEGIIMENYTGVWSLGNIKEFIEKYKLGGVFKSRQFKNQCFNLERKIPFDVYEKITSSEGIDAADMDEFEKDYRNYLYEYERYLFYRNVMD